MQKIGSYHLNVRQEVCTYVPEVCIMHVTAWSRYLIMKDDQLLKNNLVSPARIIHGLLWRFLQNHCSCQIRVWKVDVRSDVKTSSKVFTSSAKEARFVQNEAQGQATDLFWSWLWWRWLSWLMSWRRISLGHRYAEEEGQTKCGALHKKVLHLTGDRYSDGSWIFV